MKVDEAILDRTCGAGSIDLTGPVARILTAFMCCLVIVLAMASAQRQLQHWFLIPVVLCGTLIGADALSFLTGRIELMDPVAILGLLGIHFFFLAPLLHVSWDRWLPYIVGPPEWREWLGWMAILNLIGLVLYQVVRSHSAQMLRQKRQKKIWLIDETRAGFVLTSLLVISAIAQLWVYIHFGGISGYIDAYMEGEHHFANKDVGIGFNGMGWIFMISESFPILAMFAFANYLHRSNKRPATLAIYGVMAAYFALVMLFGGLRGSRSNTIWALFWAVGVIHFWVRKINRGVILGGLAFLLFFMYFYGFYKSVGTEALSGFESAEARDELTRETGRSFEGSLLGDLGRSDIQAFILFRTLTAHDSYDFGWGRTYLGAAAILIPRSIWPDRPPKKERWVTELESGPGSFDAGIWESSHVTGMAGEAMLNFGAAAVPIAYAVLGLIVAWIRNWMQSLAPDDSRWLLAPLLIMVAFIVMASDSDNDLFFVFKYGTVPLLAVFLSSRRLNLPALEFPR